MGGRQLQAKKHLGFPAAPWSRERGLERILPLSLRTEPGPAGTLTLDF